MLSSIVDCFCWSLTIDFIKGTTSIISKADIESVTIGTNVTSISNQAFAYCSSLTSVSFESGSQLTSISGYVFSDTGLTTITIPSSVTSIDNNAFSGVSNFTMNIESGSSLNLTAGSGQTLYGGTNVTVNLLS